MENVGRKMDLDDLDMVSGGIGGELSEERKQQVLTFARRFKKKGMSLGAVISNVKPDSRDAVAAYLHTVWDSIEE